MKEITSQKKKLFKAKKKQINKYRGSEGQETFAFFILLILNRFLSAEWFPLFSLSVIIINHKHKSILAKTSETQVSWSLDSCTH